MSEFITEWMPDAHLYREPIVRCKDCKFSEVVTDCYSDKPFLGCNAEWCEGSEGDHPCVEPDGFCKWGERRE